LRYTILEPESSHGPQDRGSGRPVGKGGGLSRSEGGEGHGGDEAGGGSSSASRDDSVRGGSSLSLYPSLSLARARSLSVSLCRSLSLSRSRSHSRSISLSPSHSDMRTRVLSARPRVLGEEADARLGIYLLYLLYLLDLPLRTLASCLECTDESVRGGNRRAELAASAAAPRRGAENDTGDLWVRIIHVSICTFVL
jgi:hypothetical protein